MENCPVCQSTTLSHFDTFEHAQVSLEYQICGLCGLVFQSQQPTEEELKAFYREGYRSLYQESEEPTRKDLVMQSTRAAVALKMISPLIHHVERHLDIGSSSGAFLKVVSEKFGNQMIGVEPGEGYRRYSEAHGVLAYGSIDDLLDKNERLFDFVSMMHVLEHLSDPLQVLKDLGEHEMTRGGYLLIEVPNLYEHESLELAHLYAFNPATLANLVRRAGFQVLWVKAHGSFRSPILKLYITLLAQLPKSPIPLRRNRVLPWMIKFRRKIGGFKRRTFTRLFPDWTWQAPKVLWEDEE